VFFAPSEGSAGGRGADPEIDLPLDGDPEAPPETTSAAQAAVADDIIGPPPHEPSPVAPPRAAPSPVDPPPVAPPPVASSPVAPPPVASSPVTPPPVAPSVAPPVAPRPGVDPESVAEAPAARPEDSSSSAAAAPPPPPPDDPPVISGIDTLPDPRPGPTTPPIAQANGHSFHPKGGPAPGRRNGGPVPGQDTGGDQPRGPWADLEGGYQPEDRTDEVITAYPSARPGPAGAIHGVGITVLVTNLARSIAFYRDMLGFFEIDSGQGSAVLASGDTRLVLRTVHDLSTEAGRLIYLNLEVGDVEAVYNELKAKGVTFVHAPRPVNRGDKLELWSATFTDPDRHNIAVSQWRAIN
jgi:catechol 2,3-dioxygenase-like lactoylglutathione lyase family enzyme